jgi:hypothetical protein
MKPVLRLVLILLFAVVAAAGGMVPSDASAEPVPAAAADQPMMAIPGGDCDACARERMDAGMAGCGFVCVGAPVAIGATQLPRPSSVSSAQLRADDWHLSGRVRQPEPTPPKQFLI